MQYQQNNKKALPNITFTLNVLSENAIIFFEWVRNGLQNLIEKVIRSQIPKVHPQSVA